LLWTHSLWSRSGGFIIVGLMTSISWPVSINS
jgi:hypothetical protein